MKIHFLELMKDWKKKSVLESVKLLQALPDETKVTTFEDLMGILEDERPYILDFAKALQKHGFATYTKGSRGHSSRVEWTYPPRVLGKAILGDTAELDEMIRLTQGLPQLGEAGYRGKKNWKLSEILEILSQKSGIATPDLVIDLRIPEAKRMLALSQGIPEDNVDVRIGW